MPSYSDSGVYTLCLDASNGVEPDATQTFLLYVTAPGAPPVLTATQEPGSTVTAGLTLTSGSKSFTGFTTSTTGDEGTVEFDSEGPMTETFTATLNVGWDDLGYCVPFADGNVAPVCPPTYVVVPGPEGGTGAQTTPPGVIAQPCADGQTSASLPTSGVGWCSLSETYTYVTTGSVEETNIAEVLYGDGDMTASHG
jgi:hypothetical protein